MEKLLVLIKGAGEMASAIAHRIVLAGGQVVMTEIPFPLVIRRTVSFAQAIFTQQCEIEGITGTLVEEKDIECTLLRGKVAVVVDPSFHLRETLRPDILIDATMAKKNQDFDISQAPLVLAIGPGFEAGRDVHYCIETMRGHDLGRVISQGFAMPDTGIPGDIAGFTEERIVRAAGAGIFQSERKIGDIVEKDSIIGHIGKTEIRARIQGVLRGLIANGALCKEGLKIGDIDPRGIRTHCWQISDKARAIAGGILEAILRFYPLKK